MIRSARHARTWTGRRRPRRVTSRSRLGPKVQAMTADVSPLPRYLLDRWPGVEPNVLRLGLAKPYVRLAMTLNGPERTAERRELKARSTGPRLTPFTNLIIEVRPQRPKFDSRRRRGAVRPRPRRATGRRRAARPRNDTGGLAAPGGCPEGHDRLIGNPSRQDSLLVTRQHVGGFDIDSQPRNQLTDVSVQALPPHPAWVMPRRWSRPYRCVGPKHVPRVQRKATERGRS